jgi:hypothetical protein
MFYDALEDFMTQNGEIELSVMQQDVKFPFYSYVDK